MGQFSLTHIALVLFILLLFFGPSKLPQLGQSIGKAIRGFKDGLDELKGEIAEIPEPRPASAMEKLAGFVEPAVNAISEPKE